MKQTMKLIKDILQGVAIGVANIIPGVSGGTMMVSMGIYADVISAVTGIFSHFKKSVKMLFPYAVGMLIGIVSLSFAIGYLFEYYPFQTVMLFIGLIFGGVPLILPKVAGARATVTEILLFLAAFALIVGMEFLQQGTDKALTADAATIIKLFLIGTVAAATMVIPGVSGSMLLMSLGYYTPIINCINEFILAVFALQWGKIWGCMGILVPFGIGVVLGIFLISKLVEYLLSRHERKTYFAILGLLAASPIAVFSGMSMGSLGFASVLVGIVLFIVGFIVANVLGK